MALVFSKWENLVYFKVNPFQVDVHLFSDECIQILIEQSEKEQEQVRNAMIEWLVDNPKIRDKQQFVQFNQAVLIRLLDKLYSYKQQKLAERIIDLYDAISRHLENTLNFIEDFFANYFDRNEKVPAAYGVEPGDYLLLMARMEEENNIEMVLNGFCSSGSSKKMLVVGNFSNHHGQYLKNKFSEDARIVFAGAIFEQERLHSLKAFSFLYFHGHSTGGTNPSLLEAMASGALILAHDNAFNRSVLGEDGYYFSSAAGVREFLDGFVRGAAEEEMTRRNFEKVGERYSWPDVIERYERFILRSVFVFRNERNLVYRRYSRE